MNPTLHTAGRVVLSYLTWQACAADADHLGVDPDDYCLLTG